jgi:hypothetical protein
LLNQKGSGSRVLIAQEYHISFNIKLQNIFLEIEEEA